MPFRRIPAAAVAFKAPASAFLLRALRDDDEYLDNARAAIAGQLNATTGHPHGIIVSSYSFSFTDRITTVASVNDKVDFRFGGTSQAAANVTATLSAGTRTLANHAAHVQAQMRSAATSSTEISVTYDSTVGSLTRGLFLIQHTGASDSPHTRVLELHFASGSNTAKCAGPAMGFPKHDLKKAYGYRGENGFASGYTQETIGIRSGGLLSTDAWVAGAFTTAKLANSVVPTVAFQNSAVEGSAAGNNIADKAVDGAKMGEPVQITTSPFAMPRSGAGNTPMVTCINRDTTQFVRFADLYVDALTHSSGADWNLTIVDSSGTSANIKAAAY